jgi:hypothetical protein
VDLEHGVRKPVEQQLDWKKELRGQSERADKVRVKQISEYSKPVLAEDLDEERLI